jgi:hypothetical protein
MKSALLLVVFVAVVASEIATNTVLRSNQIIRQINGSGKPTVVAVKSNYQLSGQPS